jgi:hypothetical protein
MKLLLPRVALILGPGHERRRLEAVHRSLVPPQMTTSRLTLA